MIVWTLLINEGAGVIIENKDADAKLTLGDGAVKATIADHMQALWEAMMDTYLFHEHIDSMGGTGAVSSGPMDSWDANINSGKLTFPDG